VGRSGRDRRALRAGCVAVVSGLVIPMPWQIIEDAKGFLHIHHPNEDDGETQGDLVATVFQDERHAHLMKAAPELLAMLKFCVERDPGLKAHAKVMAAIAHATGVDA